MEWNFATFILLIIHIIWISYPISIIISGDYGDKVKEKKDERDR